MIKCKVGILVFILCGWFIFPSAGDVLLMESGNYAINWDVIGSGGEPSTSVSFALGGTIGQGIVGLSSSASYGLCGGYWCIGEIETHIYLPLVMQNN
jgi:hypothetical protein